jgi:hypothetical protein
MNASDHLLAIEQIKQLKARYFRCMDTKDWAGLRSVFCDDAVFDARASLSLDGAQSTMAIATRSRSCPRPKHAA